MKKKSDTFIGPASISRRILAFLVDIVILNFIILFPFNSLISRILPIDLSYSELSVYMQSNSSVLLLLTITFAVIGLIIMFYFSYFEYKIKQTPGKMIFGLYIVAEKDISFLNYFLSNLVFLFITPYIIILWIVEFVYMIMSPKNQTLLQKLNKIMVVQRYNF